MKVVNNIFGTPFGIIKVLVLNMLSETDIKLPPILSKVLFHNSFRSNLDVSDDIIRYASKSYITDEFKTFFIMFSKKHYKVSPITIEIGKNIKAHLDEIKPILRLYRKYVGEYKIITFSTNTSDTLADEILFDENIKKTLATDIKNLNFITKQSNLTQVFDFYYVKSDLYTCAYIIKQIINLPLTWEYAEAIGHYNHLLGKQSIAKKFLLKSIDLGSTRIHRVWCSIGLIANRYTVQNKLDYSLQVFSKALNSLEHIKMDKNSKDYERAVILNAKAYSLFQKKEFLETENVLNECIFLLKNINNIRRRQFKAVVFDNYSMIEFSKKNYEKAKYYSEQAIELYHNYHRYHFHRGLIENSLNNYHDAVKHLNMAKQLSPSSINVRNLLVNIYEKLDKLNEANDELLQLQNLSENTNLWQDRISINKVLLGDDTNLNEIISKYRNVI